MSDKPPRGGPARALTNTDVPSGGLIALLRSLALKVEVFEISDACSPGCQEVAAAMDEAKDPDFGADLAMRR